MGDDLAASNVNRSYSLAATSIAIFTFMLIFLYPRFASGEVNPLLFQATLVVMGVATWLASTIVVGQLASAQPYAAPSLELDAIIAVIIGGSRLAGIRHGSWPDPGDRTRGPRRERVGPQPLAIQQ